MRNRLPVIISALAVIAMCCFIFFMSARPADESGAMSMEVASRIISFIVPGFADLSAAEQLVQLKAVDHVVRKIAHFSEYAILGALVANLLHATAEPGKWRQLAPRYVAAAWILATAYAVTDEIHQIFVPGRSCMLTDVLIDSAGVLVGVLLFAGALALKRR